MRRRQQASPPEEWGRAVPAECDPLEALIRSETCAEILEQLRPQEFLMAVLRSQGYTDAEIAERFGVHRSQIARRMIAAHRRIERDLPEAARWLRGRRRRKPSKRANCTVRHHRRAE